MLKNFEAVKAAAQVKGPQTICVAVAQDEDVLTALLEAQKCGLARSVLVGEGKLIEEMALKVGLTDYRIVDEPDQAKASLKAAELVRQGEAKILMKGLVNSSVFLRAVLNPERGLRGKRRLSHLAAFSVPNGDKLIFHTDGGMNVAPDFEAKCEILLNALETLYALGYDCPKVAVLAHNEQVDPKVATTVDAAALAALSNLPPCIIEGPIAMDVAASLEAARHKKINSQISGEVDLFLLPNIESGNLVGKTLIYYANASFAGLILGASAPIIMASRSDTPAAKLCSIALGCLAG